MGAEGVLKLIRRAVEDGYSRAEIERASGVWLPEPGQKRVQISTWRAVKEGITAMRAKQKETR